MSGPLSAEKEVENLREAFESLNDVQRGIEAALSHIDLMNFGLAKDQLRQLSGMLTRLKRKSLFWGRTEINRLTEASPPKVEPDYDVTKIAEAGDSARP